MLPILAVLPSIIVLWLVAWLSGFCGSRLPRTDWKRLPLALLALCACLGIPVLQIYLLTTLISTEFAHRAFLYILIPEFAIAALLTFVALIGDARTKKLRESSEGESQESASICATLPIAGRQEIRTDRDINGELHTVIGPVRTPDTYHFVIAVVVVGMGSILGLQVALSNIDRHMRELHGVVGGLRAFQLVSALIVGYILAIVFTEKEALILSEDRLEIRKCLLNLPVSKRSFANHEIENLRYALMKSEGRKTSLQRCGIRFEARSKVYMIGRYLSREQANDLIGQMRKVYAFPFAR